MADLKRKPRRSDCCGCKDECYFSTMSDSGECWSFRTAVITKALDIHVDARPPYSGRETARPNCYKRPRYVRVPKDALTRDGYWK